MDDIRDIYRSKYKGPVAVRENLDEKGFIAGNYISGRDSMYISVAGNEDRIILLAIYDNIGKGASGAAVQCLNLVVGQDAAFGLNL